MYVTEADRHRLYDSLKNALGQHEAETFMNMIPNTDWDDIATKTYVHAEIAELRSNMAATESRLLRSGAAWLIASQAGVIAAVAVITAFLR